MEHANPSMTKPKELFSVTHELRHSKLGPLIFRTYRSEGCGDLFAYPGTT